jgi:hypothetical protein
MRRLFGNYGNNNEEEYLRREMGRQRNAGLSWARGGSREMAAPRPRSQEQINMEAQLRRLEGMRRTTGRAPRGPESAPTEREKIAEKFASMMTSNEKKAVNNAGGSNLINKLVKEAGGPRKLIEAKEALQKFPNKNIAMKMTGASPQALNLVQNFGGPSKTNLIISANHKMNVATATVRTARKRRAKTKAKAKEVERANKVRATLLKAMVKKFTKNELVKLAGKNALGENNNKKKNNLVKNFTKYVRRQPKKRRSVTKPKTRATKK